MSNNNRANLQFLHVYLAARIIFDGKCEEQQTLQYLQYKTKRSKIWKIWDSVYLWYEYLTIKSPLFIDSCNQVSGIWFPSKIPDECFCLAGKYANYIFLLNLPVGGWWPLQDLDRRQEFRAGRIGHQNCGKHSSGIIFWGRVIVYPLSHQDSLKEWLSNPHSSILG